MEFAFSDEQRAIRDAARDYLADAATPELLRRTVDGTTGFDDALWQGLAGDMGFCGLMVPEAHGGAGLGAIEMALVLEETGRVLAPVPFFETAVLVVQAILAACDEQQRDALLPAIAAGRVKATLAGIATRPTLSGDRLSGVADYVTAAQIADLLIVATQDDTLVALSTDHPGVIIEPLPTLDRTRRFARVTFDCAVPGDAILSRDASAAIARTLAVGAGLLSAEQTGGAQYCLDSTVDYARQRVQFGRVIGSFQAYKHMLADMMTLIEASRSGALYAAAAIDEDGGELFEACHVAQSYAADCFRHCSGEAIQLHGGIGFTWEHQAHLYFKRARGASTWLGTPEQHRNALASIIFEELA